MNYLVHLYLSDDSDDGLLGNLAGDFVKGPVPEDLPSGLRLGIRQHRLIDAFAQDNPHFRQSKRRLDDRFGHCKAILVDVFYDHLLARHWSRYRSQPLEAFAARVYTLLEARFAELPPGLQQIAPRMIEHNWLVSYREIEVVEGVLKRLATRLRRANPLASGLPQLLANYQGLRQDCHQFLLEAKAFLEPRASRN